MKLTIDLREKESKLISQIKDLKGEIGGNGFEDKYYNLKEKAEWILNKLHSLSTISHKY